MDGLKKLGKKSKFSQSSFIASFNLKEIIMKQLNFTTFIFKFYLIIFSFLVISDEVKAQPEIKNSEESKSTFPNSQQDKIAQCWMMGFATIQLMEESGYKKPPPMIDRQGVNHVGLLMFEAEVSMKLADIVKPKDFLDQKRFKYIFDFYRQYLLLPEKNISRYNSEFEAYYKTWMPMLQDCNDFLKKITDKKQKSN